METQLPDDTKIWHYMPSWKCERTFSLGPCWKGVKTGCALWFSRLSAFQDEMEGKCPEENVKRMKGCARKEFGEDGLREITAELKKRELRQRYAAFVNCWHINDKESTEMWTLYGGAPEGVAIQSTVGDVRYCLDLHGGGKVVYYHSAEGFRSHSLGTQDKFLKTTSYDWENEFRLVINDEKLVESVERDEDIKLSELSPGIRVGISDPGKLMNRLVVAPGASEAFMDKIKGLCAALKMSSLAGKLERSYFHYEWLNHPPSPVA